MFKDVKINGKKIYMTIDTGVDVTILPVADWEMLGSAWSDRSLFRKLTDFGLHIRAPSTIGEIFR